MLVTIVLGLLGFYYAQKQKIWLYLSGAVICVIVGVWLGTELEQGRASPSSSAPSELPPNNLAGYFDFEKENVENWQVASNRVQIDQITLSSEQAYRGKWALKLETYLEEGGDNATIRTLLTEPRPQGGWIAQIYVPAGFSPNTIVWANFFTYSKSDWRDSTAQSLIRGAWNSLIWDTHDVDWGTKREVTIGIQIGIAGGSYRGPIFIDDVQAFVR